MTQPEKIYITVILLFFFPGIIILRFYIDLQYKDYVSILDLNWGPWSVYLGKEFYSKAQD